MLLIHLIISEEFQTLQIYFLRHLLIFISQSIKIYKMYMLSCHLHIYMYIYIYVPIKLCILYYYVFPHPAVQVWLTVGLSDCKGLF